MATTSVPKGSSPHRIGEARSDESSSPPGESPRTVTAKLIASHLVSGTLRPGEEIGIRVDQTLTQERDGNGRRWQNYPSVTAHVSAVLPVRLNL